MFNIHGHRMDRAKIRQALIDVGSPGSQVGKNITAEVRGEERWETVSIQEALLLDRLTVMRCPECYGPVRAQKGGIRGAKFIHIKQHDGCPRSYDFKGNFRLHPNDLE